MHHNSFAVRLLLALFDRRGHAVAWELLHQCHHYHILKRERGTSSRKNTSLNGTRSLTLCYDPKKHVAGTQVQTSCFHTLSSVFFLEGVQTIAKLASRSFPRSSFVWDKISWTKITEMWKGWRVQFWDPYNRCLTVSTTLTDPLMCPDITWLWLTVLRLLRDSSAV